MRCFVDTSGLLAVLNRNDERHGEAAVAWQRLLTEDASLVTSSYVLVESFALCQNRLGVEAVQLLQRDAVPLLEVVWVDGIVHSAAVSALLTAGRRQLTLVDCASFEIMRRTDLTHAFAYDAHFAEQGFVLVA